MTGGLPEIKIKAQSNHHALFLMLLAILLGIITLSFSQNYWRQYQLVLIFIFLSILVVFITGLAKSLQPKFSLYLSPKDIKYQHSFGYWYVTWQQIQGIALIKETIDLDQVLLPYIGIRLTEISLLAQQVSPRLANRLIHEQRPLIALAIKQKLLTLEQGQLNFTAFELASGKSITGPIAAFLHHCTILQTAFGYHLFIPETALDRELGEFCQLLNQCKTYAAKYH